MLTDSTMAPVVPRWMVEVEAAFTDAGRPTPGPDELEPLVELLYRTEGVRSVVAVPRRAGLAVMVDLAVPDADAALQRGRTLVASCARYAGLGEVVIDRVQVTPRHDVATPWRFV